MNVLVVGGGGREHAIVHALAKSPKLDKLWCAPGNGGIAAEAECVEIKATDIPAMVLFAKEHDVDYVVVAPDDPLAGYGGRFGRSGHSRFRSSQKRRHP